MQAAGNIKAVDLSGSNQEPGTGVENQEIDTVWNHDTMASVQKFAKTHADIKDQRKALNDQLAAAKSGLIAKGFNGDAMEAAIKYANTAEEKRENFDLTYLYWRKALGHPVQDDLFVAALQERVNTAKSKNSDKTH